MIILMHLWGDNHSLNMIHSTFVSEKTGAQLLYFWFLKCYPVSRVIIVNHWNVFIWFFFYKYYKYSINLRFTGSPNFMTLVIVLLYACIWIQYQVVYILYGVRCISILELREYKNSRPLTFHLIYVVFFCSHRRHLKKNRKKNIPYTQIFH